MSGDAAFVSALNKVAQRAKQRATLEIDVNFAELGVAAGTKTFPKWNLTINEFFQYHKVLSQNGFGLKRIDTAGTNSGSLVSAVWMRDSQIAVGELTSNEINEFVNSLYRAGHLVSQIAAFDDNWERKYLVSWMTEATGLGYYCYIDLDDGALVQTQESLARENITIVNRQCYRNAYGRRFSIVGQTGISSGSFFVTFSLDPLGIQNWVNRLSNYSHIPLQLQGDILDGYHEYYGISFWSGVAPRWAWEVGLSSSELAEKQRQLVINGFEIADIASYGDGANTWHNVIWFENTFLT